MTSLLATDYTQQAQVTNWPARIVLVVVVLALIALALWGMRRGWRGRQARQAWIPAPIDQPGDVELSDPVEGLYIGTAMASDWMDRVAVHDLGVRSRASIQWGSAGIYVDRVGTRSIFIPAHDIDAVRLDRGVAGTVKAKDSVIVVTWRLGEAVVDSGFRADHGDGHAAVLDGLAETFDVDLNTKENGGSRHA